MRLVKSDQSHLQACRIRPRSYVAIKCQLDATEFFIADLIACSTCFGDHYANHQELKNIIQWLLHEVFDALKMLKYVETDQGPLETRSNRSQRFHQTYTVNGNNCLAEGNDAGDDNNVYDDSDDSHHIRMH